MQQLWVRMVSRMLLRLFVVIVVVVAVLVGIVAFAVVSFFLDAGIVFLVCAVVVCFCCV